MKPFEKVRPRDVGGASAFYGNIIGARCRKIGKGRLVPGYGLLVSIDQCSACKDFEPAVKVSTGDDALEGNDGIDPRTGNSYATCKWFGEIVRSKPLFGARKVA